MMTLSELTELIPAISLLITSIAGLIKVLNNKKEEPQKSQQTKQESSSSIAKEDNLPRGD